MGNGCQNSIVSLGLIDRFQRQITCVARGNGNKQLQVLKRENVGEEQEESGRLNESVQSCVYYSQKSNV